MNVILQINEMTRQAYIPQYISADSSELSFQCARVGSEPMLTGVSPRVTPQLAACNQVKSHDARTRPFPFETKCFMTAWKYNTLEIAQESRLT